MSQHLRSLNWTGSELVILDQTRLPNEVTTITCTSHEQVASAIHNLIVRGAPAIGVAAGYAMVLAIRNLLAQGLTGDNLKAAYEAASHTVESARPTAVNLSWAVGQMRKVFENTPEEKLLSEMEKRAAAIETEDRTICSLIGENGSRLFEGKDNLQILTHCNTGALATSGIGTALGVILTLHSHNQVGCVYADETRPVLQGARLTAVELQRAGVPSKLICDNMAALVMRTQPIDAVIVGADRIATNGDTANKIGTYGLAVLAKYHNVPFYIAAPFSTFDFSIPTGNEIVIEERNPDEVRQVGGVYTAPEDMDVFNPAFDVTPHELISGIITEKGVIFHPDEISIKAYERSLQL